MKIGIITYNKPHRKTQEVVFGLKEIGYKKIKFIICKFKNLKKKKNLNYFEHRPYQFSGPNFIELSRYLGINYTLYEDANVFKNLDIVLVCGSGIIKQKLIKKNFILNCHSGLIPLKRFRLF